MKRALLIGINYFDTESELGGCHNDVDAMQKLLVDTFHFDAQDIEIMKDVKGDKAHLEPDSPTRHNIMQRMKELVAKTKSGDTLYVHYSGHGTWGWDRNHDERDQRDELICPVDDAYINDDELYSILVLPLPYGAKLRCIFDCCHSGTILDLPCQWRFGNYTYSRRVPKSVINLDCLMLSGCKDTQTSADAWIGSERNGDYAGAMTWAFESAVRELGEDRLRDMTWKDLIYRIRWLLKKGEYTQVPQLSCCRKSQLKEQITM